LEFLTNGNVFPVRSPKVYVGIEVQRHSFLISELDRFNLQLDAQSASTPRKSLRYPLNGRLCAPEPVWTLKRTDKSLAPGGNRHSSDVQPVAWSLY